MNKFKLFYLLLVAPLILSVSCTKDEPEPEVTYVKPVASSRTTLIDIPTGLQNSSDPNKILATSWIGTANSLMAMSSYFTVPENAQTGTDKGSSTVYFWTGGGHSYWMTYNETDTKYTWKYEWQWPGINKFTFIEADELKNGTGGSWIIYAIDEPHSKVWEYTWSLVSNDFSAIAWLYGYESHDNIKFEVSDKADNSGYFKVFEGAVHIVQISWNANGSGTWWVTDGSTTYSGTWN